LTGDVGRCRRHTQEEEEAAEGDADGSMVGGLAWQFLQLMSG